MISSAVTGTTVISTEVLSAVRIEGTYCDEVSYIATVEAFEALLPPHEPQGMHVPEIPQGEHACSRCGLALQAPLGCEERIG